MGPELRQIRKVEPACAVWSHAPAFGSCLTDFLAWQGQCVPSNRLAIGRATWTLKCNHTRRHADDSIRPRSCSRKKRMRGMRRDELANEIVPKDVREGRDVRGHDDPHSNFTSPGGFTVRMSHLHLNWSRIYAWLIGSSNRCLFDSRLCPAYSNSFEGECFTVSPSAVYQASVLANWRGLSRKGNPF